MRFLLGWIVAVLFLTPVAADDKSDDPSGLTSRLKKAVKKAVDDDQTYDLHYRFNAGETVRWKVEHLVAHETKMQGVHQPAKR